MSSKSVWKWTMATLAAVSTVAVAYAVNELTGDNPEWWWWLVVAIGTVMGIPCAVSGVVIEVRARRSRTAPARTEGGGVAEQQASGQGSNISITADRGSAAALNMGNVTMGNPRRGAKRTRRD